MERSKSKWDRRSSPENERKRRKTEGSSKRDDPGDRHSRQKDSDNRRYRSYEDNRSHRDDNRNRNYDKRSRDEEDHRRTKMSRFEKPFVKQERSPEWGKPSIKEESKSNVKTEKEKPNFGLSGKLTEDTNTVNGVVVKYAETQNARKPKRRWRLYPFKGEKALPVLYIHRQSAYLIGRDRKVADIPLDHPSISKQHAALQYQLVPFKRDDGSEGKRIRPYLIDLESANGTLINNEKMEPRRFYELMERDVIKFGFSSREYVVLHEQSKDEVLDDDIANEN